MSEAEEQFEVSEDHKSKAHQLERRLIAGDVSPNETAERLAEAILKYRGNPHPSAEEVAQYMQGLERRHAKG